MNGNTAVKHVEIDKKSAAWDEVMKLVAEKHGFIRFVYGEFAMLSIDEEAMKTK